jgi:5'-nucleotidase
MRALGILLLISLLSCRTPQTAVAAPAPSRSAQAATEEALTRLTIVATNDFHGWVNAREYRLPDGSSFREGGADAFAGYLKVLRQDNPGGVLLLDGGDLFQGTLAANLTEGRVVIDVFNRLGYTAASLGNHEFDYGPVGPVSVATEVDMDAFGALKARLAEARFPLLAVNIYDAQTGQRPEWLGNDGTTMLEVKGIKVGILGLITPTTPQTTNPVNVASLRFGSLVPEALSAAKRLRERGAEFVIAVAHAGGKCASLEDPRDISNCDSGGEVFELLEELPPKTLDLVVAGHTHQPLGHFIHGTPVIESPGLGRAFGTVDLFFDGQGTLLPDRTRIRADIPICIQVDPLSKRCDEKHVSVGSASALVAAELLGKKIQLDDSIAQVIRPALELAEAEQRRSLGLRVPERLGRNYEGESPLGRLLTESMRQMEKADVALMNSGGLRADLPAGELTYGQVYEVLPFDNTLATLTMTGEELDRLLHAAYGARKGVFQISGLKVSLARCATKDRLRTYKFEDGRPVRMDKRYKIVMPDFLARGGDGLGGVLSTLAPNRVDLGTSRPENFRDALVSYWQRVGNPLAPVGSPRIQFLDEKTPCVGTAADARP